MKKIILLATLSCAVMLSSIGFTSCSKDDEGSNNADVAGLVKSLANADLNMTWATFSYDSQKRVTKIDFPDDGDYITYTYYSDRIVVGGTYFYNATIYLNADNTMDKMVWTDEGYTYEYTYNTDGNLSHADLTYSSGSSSTSVTWTNGNITAEGGESYTYDTSVYNNTNVDLNMLIACLGDSTIGDCYVLAGLKSVVNGIWSTNMISYCDGDDYVYEVNASGQITKITVDGDVLTVSYY